MLYFVTSDLHGHATLFREALERAGFDNGNPEHTLIVCGDCFDRGAENPQVLAFLNGIRRRILIRGNHDDLLEKALYRHRLSDTHYANGTELTVRQFYGENAIDATGRIWADPDAEEKLFDYLGELRDYFETEHYIFVHGWLPLLFAGKTPQVDPDWRNADADTWSSARWIQWQQAYDYRLTVPGKTVVCGHRTSRLGHLFDPNRLPEDSSPFFGDGIIALDALTALSGQVNVVVLED